MNTLRTESKIWSEIERLDSQLENESLNKFLSKENEKQIVNNLVKTRDKFLMIDLFPENEFRFPSIN